VHHAVLMEQNMMTCETKTMKKTLLVVMKALAVTSKALAVTCLQLFITTAL
jgi:hypothetical protein